MVDVASDIASISAPAVFFDPVHCEAGRAVRVTGVWRKFISPVYQIEMSIAIR